MSIWTKIIARHSLIGYRISNREKISLRFHRILKTNIVGTWRQTDEKYFPPLNRWNAFDYISSTCPSSRLLLVSTGEREEGIPSVVTRETVARIDPAAGLFSRGNLFRFAFYQAANLFFAAAFLVPRSFKASVLALRTFLTAGFMLAALWAGITICALDAMLWCLALGLLNGIHSLILACRFLPPALSPELAELYLKLFKPYKVSKKHFQELAKEARILKLDSGQTYATEGVTPADERLSILLRGKWVSSIRCSNMSMFLLLFYIFFFFPSKRYIGEIRNSPFRS